MPDPSSITCSLGTFERLSRNGAAVTITFGCGSLLIQPLADDLVRIRAHCAGADAPDVSWVVVKRDWPEESVAVGEFHDTIEVRTPGLSVSVRRTDGTFTVRSASGMVVLDNARIHWSGGMPEITWTQPADRHCYGCGEKAGPLERRGAPMTFWNAEAFGYGPGPDPLYQSIPFTLVMDGALAGGLFVDNTWRQVWDLGRPGETEASIQADGGAMDLYVFAAKGPKDVLDRWTELSGRQPLPPLWALGYQQSRWSYYPEDVVKELAKNFRERRIPCDVIWFDIDYMDAYKDFTWDRARFPDPKRLLSDLKADGFQSVVILDPGVKVQNGYSVYEELKANGFSVKNADGTPFIGPVWPGDCLFPDFTDAKCRAWWGEQYQPLVEAGVSGFWNDMNEPAVFEAEGHTMPPDARFAGDGHPGSHLQYHNIYGMQMARATYEGIRQLRPEERAFVLTRSAFAGAQRYAATWTGDNAASWPGVGLSVAMVMNLGLSGQGISGPDIGGFAGDPTPELFARWLQVGALFPFCRCHHAASEHKGAFDYRTAASQEPWSFGADWTDINRASIELRYRLMPYLYTCFEEMSRTGVPVFRPLFLEYPADPRCAGLDDQFLVGRNLLCAPVLEEGKSSRTVYLPEGAWYDFWTDERLEGGRQIMVDAPISKLPLYVRAGAVLPVQPVVQHTGEMGSQALEFRIYSGNRTGDETDVLAEGEVYEDDGHSMAYLEGDYLRTRVTVTTLSGQPDIRTATEGSYRSPRPPARFTIIGF